MRLPVPRAVLAALVVSVLFATYAAVGVPHAAAYNSSTIYGNPPSLCYAHDGWLLHGYGRIDNSGSAWTTNGANCGSALSYPVGQNHTTVETFTGLYGGTITLCAYQSGQNPYGSDTSKTFVHYNVPDCGPNFYFGDNYSSLTVYGGGTISGDVQYDLQM